MENKKVPVHFQLPVVPVERPDENELMSIITALTSELVRIDPTNLLAAATAKYMVDCLYWHFPGE